MRDPREPQTPWLWVTCVGAPMVASGPEATSPISLGLNWNVIPVVPVAPWSAPKPTVSPDIRLCRSLARL